jgi:hypothetical protein
VCDAGVSWLGCGFCLAECRFEPNFFIFFDCFLKNNFKMGKNRMFSIKIEKFITGVRLRQAGGVN